MRYTLGIKIVRLICLTAFLVMTLGVARAQNRGSADAASAGEGPTLKALLEEVRLLRLEIQRANLQTYRTQVLLSQLRIQQEHVDRLSRQLDVTRNELADTKMARTQLEGRIKDVEEKIDSEPDEETRAKVRLMLKDLQLELQEQREKERAKVERESQLSAELLSEQSKVSELNDRLEALEREFENAARPEQERPIKRN